MNKGTGMDIAVVTENEIENIITAETENVSSEQQTNQNDTPSREQAPAQPSTSEEKKEEKTKKTRKTNHCREDHEHKRLIVTKETSKPGTAAFNELMGKRKLYPDYTITYRTANSSDRLSVRDLSVEDMEQFIKLTYNNDKKRMAEFNLQNQLSELYPAPITYLRNWFRRNYRNYWTNAKKAANA